MTLSRPPGSAFLADLLESLRRRRKAIRRHVRDFAVEKVLEREDGEELEKLEVECGLPGRERTTVRLFVWEDRWVWVDARSMVDRKQGWAWEFSAEGRAAGGADGRRLVEALEASIAAASPVEDDNAAILRGLWKPLLAAGPSLARQGSPIADSREHGHRCGGRP